MMTSPNFDDRAGQTVDMLVLHYTGMQSGKEALERLCDPEAKVSAHYLVEEDGSVFQLVDEEKRAWHAGVSSWRGHTNINARSIGIEIVNPGHEWGYRAFPDVQMQAVLAVCQSVLSRHNIPARNVVGHSDVAPKRKQDPGELFDWAWLAAHEVGLFPSALSAANHIDAASALHQFGYDVSHLSAAVTAFQRHFRQDQVNGQWDAECQAILDALLKQV